MQIGAWIDEDRPLPDVLAAIEAAERDGYARAWVSQRFGWDALTVLAALGSRAPGIDLGTAVATTFPKHPMALAEQAMTASAATGGRLSLGIGPGHQPVVEGTFGYRWDRPARHVREYLDVLLPLVQGADVAVRGELVSATGAITSPGAVAPPVLIAALGPVMLRLAGERTAGTITTWAGPRSLDEYFVPTITAGAVGRPAPQVVAGVCVCVTSDAEGARGWVQAMFGRAGDLPSYQRIFEREGVAGPADTAVVGDESFVERELERYAAAGATEVQVIAVGPPDDQARTRTVLGAMAAARSRRPRS